MGGRGKTVKPEISNFIAYSTDPESDDVKLISKMLNLGKLANTMDRSSTDCIREGKNNNFPVFSEVPDPEERTD